MESLTADILLYLNPEKDFYQAFQLPLFRSLIEPIKYVSKKQILGCITKDLAYHNLVKTPLELELKDNEIICPKAINCWDVDETDLLPLLPLCTLSSPLDFRMDISYPFSRLQFPLNWVWQNSLTSLCLRHGQITTLPEGVFETVPSLTYLNLNDNKIATLPERIFGTALLTVLDLSNNQLTTIPEEFFSGGNNSSLRVLDLSGNQLTNLPEGSIKIFKSLKVLDLSGNQLTNISKRTFWDSDLGQSMEILNLSGNRLTSLHEDIFYVCTSLRVLILSGNLLTSLPRGLIRKPGAGRFLETLNLAENRLTTLPEGFLDYSDSLSHLDLSGNYFSRLPREVFSRINNPWVKDDLIKMWCT